MVSPLFAAACAAVITFIPQVAGTSKANLREAHESTSWAGPAVAAVAFFMRRQNKGVAGPWHDFGGFREFVSKQYPYNSTSIVFPYVSRTKLTKLTKLT
jgi:hypothetical protein